MVKVSFITPLDQPTGSKRLLNVLRTGLNDPRFDRLRMVVAYAKSGPLVRLQSDLRNWRDAGKSLSAVFGVDQQGTSKEALAAAVDLCSDLYVTREHGITFHPKIYLFNGEAHARAIIGSNNLTVGGTETNFECSTIIDITLPDGNDVYIELSTLWESLLPAACAATKILDEHLFDELIASGVVLSETQLLARSRTTTRHPSAPRSGLQVRPASPIPAGSMMANAVNLGSTPPPPPTTHRLQPIATGLAIQIKPHRNGEIFLSKRAVQQNPGFFGWPFTGHTVPKKAHNASYPQREPDPIANIEVYGASPIPRLSLRNYALNTVYYSTNSEIRITASPLVSEVPPYSIMIMTPGGSTGIDYDIIIHRPDSPDYAVWLGACNQLMPGGGQSPRKFGWF